MVTRQLTLAGPVISLLLIATPLYGQQVAFEDDTVSSKSLTELQQALAKSRAELEARRQNNLRMAKQRKELETEVVRLQELLLQQEQKKAAASAPKNTTPSSEQKQPVTQ